MVESASRDQFQQFLRWSDSEENPCRISMQTYPFVTNAAEICREFKGSKQISCKSNT